MCHYKCYLYLALDIDCLTTCHAYLVPFFFLIAGLNLDCFVSFQILKGSSADNVSASTGINQCFSIQIRRELQFNV